MEQRSSDWFQARLGKATGSRFHDICTTIKYGESAARKNYKYQLIAERLTGKQVDFYTTQAMQWGIDNEASARLAYEFKTGYQVQEEGFLISPTVPDAGVSPDGLIGLDGGVEFKCPETATHIETLTSKQIPSKYLEQCIGGMWVTGRKWWDFVSYDPRMPEDLQLVIIRLWRNEQDIQDLENEIIEFLNDVDRELMRIFELRDNL